VNTKHRSSFDEPSGSRFIFIDAPDGYEIEIIERPLSTALA